MWIGAYPANELRSRELIAFLSLLSHLESRSRFRSGHGLQILLFKFIIYSFCAAKCTVNWKPEAPGAANPNSHLCNLHRTEEWRTSTLRFRGSRFGRSVSCGVFRKTSEHFGIAWTAWRVCRIRIAFLTIPIQLIIVRPWQTCEWHEHEKPRT